MTTIRIEDNAANHNPQMKMINIKENKGDEINNNGGQTEIVDGVDEETEKKVNDGVVQDLVEKESQNCTSSHNRKRIKSSNDNSTPLKQSRNE